MGPARLAAILVLTVAAACGGARAHRAEPKLQTQAGGFHVVQPGETLYRLAQTYGVALDVLARENGLDDPTKLEVGQRVFIPSVVAPPGPRPKARKLIAAHPLSTPMAEVEEPAGAGSGLWTLGSGPKASDATVPAEPSPPKAAQAKPKAQSPEPRARPKPPTAASALAWPVKGVLFSPFGVRSNEPHDGIDLAAPEGTPVVAADGGTILFAGKKRGYGNLIVMRHDGDLVTVYAHNRENLVKAGQQVSRGALIARVGRTGNATGPHLHFEVRVAARPRDPMKFLR